LAVPACTIGGFSAQQTITTNITYYIATTGNDTTGNGSSGTPWLTIAKAMSYLASFIIASGVTITITMADGHYSVAAGTSLNHPFGSQIKLTGTNTYSKTISSINARSGGAGAWSYQLVLNNANNIAIGDYVLISAMAGGTNPSFLDGCHVVTAFDVGNKYVTLTSVHKSAAYASNISSGTLVVVKAVITCAGDGLTLTVGSKFQLISNLVLAGPGATNIGITIDGSAIWIGVNVGCCNFNYGWNVQNGAILTTVTSALFSSGCTIGFLTQANSGVNLFYAIASGNTYGFYVLQSSSSDAEQTVATGNTTGYYADKAAYIRVSSNTASGNTTDYNPTINTQSGMSYIQS
jgi:hypothetical protein